MDKRIVNSSANRWILICSTISYEQKLRCLRLSLYHGMDDLLFFHKFSSSNYDYNIYNHATSCPINSVTVRQKSRKVFLITKLKRGKNSLFINLATYLAVDLALLDYESLKKTHESLREIFRQTVRRDRSMYFANHLCLQLLHYLKSLDYQLNVSNIWTSNDLGHGKNLYFLFCFSYFYDYEYYDYDYS